MTATAADPSIWSVSLPRLLGATATVLVTTLDDCVWLVPFLAQANHCHTAILSAVTFVATLTGMTVGVSIVTLVLRRTVLTPSMGATDLIISSFGAIFCWVVAGYLYYRSWRKRQRRRQQREREEQQQRAPQQEEHERNLVVGDTTTAAATERDALLQQQESQKENPSSADDASTTRRNEKPRLWMVVSLTFLGSLDEISYFPGLLLGRVFTPAELSGGALLAALTMLLIVTTCLGTCQPCMECLDRIPLFGVVGVFAILLTGEVIWDLIAPDND